MKRQIRLTESELHRLVESTVRNILREGFEDDYDDNGYEESQRYLYEDIASDIETVLNKCGFRLKEVGECNSPQYYYCIKYNVIPETNNANIEYFEAEMDDAISNGDIMCEFYKNGDNSYAFTYGGIDEVTVELSQENGNNFTMYMSQQ